MTLCAINIAALIYCWTSILLTPLPAITIGISFFCSLMFLFEPKTKKLAVFTYLSLALIALCGFTFALYSRRPIGFLVPFTAVVIVCKNFYVTRKYRKKNSFRTKMASGVCLVAVFSLISSWKIGTDCRTVRIRCGGLNAFLSLTISAPMRRPTRRSLTPRTTGSGQTSHMTVQKWMWLFSILTAGIPWYREAGYVLILRICLRRFAEVKAFRAIAWTERINAIFQADTHSTGSFLTDRGGRLT